jgi:uncharacterized membrane protein YeaQ/YmgE (transglycosylase-associated protein family)
MVEATALLVGGPNVIAWLILGGIAGTVAGRVLFGRAFGFIGNIILGLIGAWVGGTIVDLVDPTNDGFRFWGSLVIAVLGSFIVTFLWGLITHKQRTVKRA